MKAELHILNLEDNEQDAELNATTLSECWPQYELRRVDNRRDFTAALETQEQLDLILSDYTMPGFNGVQALTLAREKRPDVPFLFVSGTIGEDTAIEALKNGAADYVLKHRLTRLIPAVARALLEAEQHDERRRAERAMCESEHKYRTLFDALGDAVFLAKEKDGKIIEANRQTGYLLHCFRKDIVGHTEDQFLALERHLTPEADDPSGLVPGKLVRPD